MSEKLDTLYREMEHPLAFVLAEMEGEGVSIDVPLMRRLSHDLGERARLLEQQAHAAAGRPFALGSPKQLAEVLFNELGLPPSKKTKTGYSTDSSVLEELSAVHPLPVLVLEWRQVSKLKSTYTDVLPTLVQPRTGRIHTIFNQAVAATGRLSSEQPNLQNIPIRTETGRRIRGAFVARAGADNPILVSADYSQIELRILAHLSGDARMQQAFHDGADIHRRTAAEMLGKDESEVTGDERAMAKTINFGILYGMSAFRLAKEQGISRSEAKDYIEAYYARYPAIRTWKEGILKVGRASGYVQTLFGRIRNVSDLRSRNGIARSGAERVAINTPVQGTAADIIKKAMVSVDARLKRELPSAKMVLQVHDELVFEAPEADADALIALATEEMVGAIDLDVPLVVNAAKGRTWLEAH
ncbi:MAG: DNA polymerase-1 [Myxococcota bacterium]